MYFSCTAIASGCLLLVALGVAGGQLAPEEAAPGTSATYDVTIANASCTKGELPGLQNWCHQRRQFAETEQHPSRSALWASAIRAIASCKSGAELNGPNPQLAAAGTMFVSNALRGFNKHLAIFSNATGLQYNLTARSILQYQSYRYRIGDVLPTAKEPGPLDFWAVSAAVFGVPEANDVFLDMSMLLMNDPDYKASDIPVAWRAAMSSAWSWRGYKSIPLTVLPSHLYYRADIFAAHNISSPPHTWDDVIDIAEQFGGRDLDGDGQVEIGICMDTAECDRTTVLAILASIIQLRGTTDGIIFDPTDLRLLTQGAALREAMRIFSGLQKHGTPAKTPCLMMYSMYHMKGVCLMTIGFPNAFKLSSFPGASPRLRGNIRTVALPGSALVLDRTTGELVRCTQELCPHADRVVRQDSGEEVLVNKIVSFDSVSFVINKYAPLYRQAAAFKMLSTLSGPVDHKTMMLDFISEVSPTRFSELDLKEWMSAGYEYNNTKSFLDEYRNTMDSQNILFDLRFPGVFECKDLVGQFVQAVANLNQSIEAAEAKLRQGVEGLIQSQGGVDAMLLTYRKSLGIVEDEPAGKDAKEPLVAPSPVSEVLLIAVVLPVASIFFLAILYLLLASYRRVLYLMLLHPSEAPGPGMVVLCVTDIQDSTTLWETLPADVCQTAIQLHHMAIRKYASLHKGYESATEGDSFILAFGTSTDCTRFALRTQQALLELDWPPELLANQHASSVSVTCDAKALQHWTRFACGPTIHALLRPAFKGSALFRGQQPRQHQQFEKTASRTHRVKIAGLPSSTSVDASTQGRLQAQKSSFDASGSDLPIRTWTCTIKPEFDPGHLLVNTAVDLGTPSPNMEEICISGEDALDRSAGFWAPHPLISQDGPAVLLPTGDSRGSKTAGQPGPQWAGEHRGSHFLSQGQLSLLASPSYAAEAGPQRIRGPWPQAIRSVLLSALGRKTDSSPASPSRRGVAVLEKPRSAVLPPVLGGVSRRHTMAGVGVSSTHSASKRELQFVCGSDPSAKDAINDLRATADSMDDAATSARQPSVVGSHRSNSVSSQTTTSLRSKMERLRPSGGSCTDGMPAAATESVGFMALIAAVFPVALPGYKEGGVPAANVEETVIFRGLRVRIGFHSGVLGKAEVQFNRASQRTVYSGPVMQLAKAISDAGRGGQTTLSMETLGSLDFVFLHGESGVVLHSGLHVLKEGAPEVELYSLFSHSLLPRVAFLDEPRSQVMKAPGLLTAPLGFLAVAVAQLEDVANTWEAEASSLSHSAFASIRHQAQELANQFQGYLLMTGHEGLQAVFTDPVAAVRWLLTLQQHIDDKRNNLDSSSETGAGTEAFRPTLIMRGGIDIGALRAGLTFDGRIVYEGGACKGARGLALHAHWQEVLVSDSVARAVLGEDSPQLRDLKESLYQLTTTGRDVTMPDKGGAMEASPRRARRMSVMARRPFSTRSMVDTSSAGALPSSPCRRPGTPSNQGSVGDSDNTALEGATSPPAGCRRQLSLQQAFVGNASPWARPLTDKLRLKEALRVRSSIVLPVGAAASTNSIEPMQPVPSAAADDGQQKQSATSASSGAKRGWVLRTRALVQAANRSAGVADGANSSGAVSEVSASKEATIRSAAAGAAEDDANSSSTAVSRSASYSVSSRLPAGQAGAMPPALRSHGTVHQPWRPTRMRTLVDHRSTESAVVGSGGSSSGAFQAATSQSAATGHDELLEQALTTSEYSESWALQTAAAERTSKPRLTVATSRVTASTSTGLHIATIQQPTEAVGRVGDHPDTKAISDDARQVGNSVPFVPSVHGSIPAAGQQEPAALSLDDDEVQGDGRFPPWVIIDSDTVPAIRPPGTSNGPENGGDNEGADTDGPAGRAMANVDVQQDERPGVPFNAPDCASLAEGTPSQSYGDQMEAAASAHAHMEISDSPLLVLARKKADVSSPAELEGVVARGYPSPTPVVNGVLKHCLLAAPGQLGWCPLLFSHLRLIRFKKNRIVACRVQFDLTANS